jgi:putative N6-adenine-specific DNA methylase
MRETLAAALVMASGWDEQSPLLDPFCGSGTIPIEAALIAARIAPGRNRQFQFMRWPDFDAAQWKQVLSEANTRTRDHATPAIVGSDRNAAALRASRENAERAGVAGMLRLEKTDALHVNAEHQAGWIVSNPPYGVRLGDRSETQRLLARFGQRLCDEFAGWQVALLAPAGTERLIGFPMESRLKTTNGGLRVQVLTGVVPAAANPTRRNTTRRRAVIP